MVSDIFFPPSILFHPNFHADLDKMSDSDSDGGYHDTSQDFEDHVASVSFESNTQSKRTLCPLVSSVIMSQQFLFQKFGSSRWRNSNFVFSPSGELHSSSPR